MLIIMLSHIQQGTGGRRQIESNRRKPTDKALAAGQGWRPGRRAASERGQGSGHRDAEEPRRHPDRQCGGVSRPVKGVLRRRYPSPLTGRAAPWGAFESVWKAEDAPTGADASRPRVAGSVATHAPAVVADGVPPLLSRLRLRIRASAPGQAACARTPVTSLCEVGALAENPGLTGGARGAAWAESWYPAVSAVLWSPGSERLDVVLERRSLRMDHGLADVRGRFEVAWNWYVWKSLVAYLTAASGRRARCGSVVSGSWGGTTFPQLSGRRVGGQTRWDGTDTRYHGSASRRVGWWSSCIRRPDSCTSRASMMTSGVRSTNNTGAGR